MASPMEPSIPRAALDMEIEEEMGDEEDYQDTEASPDAWVAAGQRSLVYPN